MIVSRCPRCHEAFRLPSDAIPDDAVGRCPWCRETFPAAEVLSGLPPVLEVTSAEGQVIGGGRFDDADQSGWGTDSGGLGAAASGPLEVIEPAPGHGFDASAGPGHTESESVAPMRVSAGPSSHARRKKGSKVRTLVGIALGPVIALPLAGGILLALGRAPDLGFYPFDGTYSGRSAFSRASTEVSAPPPGPRPTPDPPSGFSPSDQPPPGRSLAEDLSDLSGAGADSAGEDPAQRVLEEISGSEDGLGAEPDEVEPSDDAGEATAADGPAAPAPRPAAPAPRPADRELTEAIDAASAQLAQLSDQKPSGEQRKRMLARAYAALARVGATAGPEDQDLVAPLIERVKNSGWVADFGAAAPKWLDFSRRPHEGAVLVGELARENDRWRMTLDSGRQVGIRLRDTLSDDPPQRVLALGTIVGSAEDQTVDVSFTEPLPSVAP